MMKRLAIATQAALASVVFAAPALAHTGLDGSYALRDGLLHPLHGLDHLLAMVAVGLLAWQMGGQARWALPFTFVSLMAFGAAAAVGGIGVSGAEVAILASVVILGLAIAIKTQGPSALVSLIVGAFGFMHGYAHGVEIPEAAGFASYALGFVTATAILHASGLGLGWVLARSSLATRLLGALIALGGVGLATA